MSAGGKRDAIRRRGGCLIRLLAVLVVVGAVGALSWMIFLPVAVTAQLRSRTGFGARVASLSCNVFTGRVTVRGLVVSNPGSFPTGDFVVLREFSLEADVGSLFSDRIVLDELTLDVRRVTLVRRADGKSNAEVFQDELLGAPGTAGGPRPAGATPARKFLIRRLSLRFDQLVIADHTGGKTAGQEFGLGLDQRYENVTDGKQLLVPEVLRRLAAANLGPVLGRLVPGDFGHTLSAAAQEASSRGGELLKDAGQKATDLFKGLREKLEENKKP